MIIINNFNCTYLAEIDLLKDKLNTMLFQIKMMKEDLIEAKYNNVISKSLIVRSKILDKNSAILINRIKTKILEISN